MILPNIHPSTPFRSDKYSRRIYTFTKKKKHYTQVYYQRDPDEILNLDDYLVNPLAPSKIHFLYNDVEVHGTSLANLINMNNKHIQTYYSLNTEEASRQGLLVDITAWFWDQYHKRGRCLYIPHETHCQDDENRMILVDEYFRKCAWCSQHFKKCTIERIETYDHWIKL